MAWKIGENIVRGEIDNRGRFGMAFLQKKRLNPQGFRWSRHSEPLHFLGTQGERSALLTKPELDSFPFSSFIQPRSGARVRRPKPNGNPKERIPPCI